MVRRQTMKSTGELVASSRQVRYRRFLWVCVGGWAVFALFNGALGRSWTTVLDLGVLALTAILLGLTRHELNLRRLQRFSHLNIALSVSGLVAASMLSGQADSMSIWYLTPAPIFAAFLIGTRAAVGWAAVVGILIAGIHVSDAMLPIEPEFVPAGWELLMGRATLMTVILGFGVAWHETTRSHIEQMKERERVIAEQAREAEAQSEILAEARDAALAASEAKGRFLANMSHEIRTPLSGVIGMSDLLLGARLDAEPRQLAQTIGASGRMLLSVVDDILELSRLESADVALHSGPLEPSGCARDVVATMSAAAAERGIALDLIVEPGTPDWVRGDDVRIRQVLLNLVGNALKFTERGGVKVRVGALRSGRVFYEVEDSGIGIPAEAREAIFDAFAQADSSTSRRFGGTGLGLAICKRLVTRMGGTISVRSVPGRGSTFRAVLPLPPARAPAPSTDPAPEGPLVPSGLRVLLAEDDPVNRDVALRMLARLGVDADLATNGLEALERVRQQTYDLVLMDMQMPEMDGVEATRRILEEHPDAHPRIIALTANVLAEQRAELEEAGVHGFMPKPVRLEALRRVLTGQTPREASEPEDPIERLRVLCRGSQSALAQMVQSHVVNSTRLYDSMLDAHRQGNREELERAAHSLKSTSAMFGSRRLSELSARLESAASESVEGVGVSDLVELGEELERAKQRLARESELPSTVGDARA